MIKYELLSTFNTSTEGLPLHETKLPDLVQLSDAALTVMIDFSSAIVPVTCLEATVDVASFEMQAHNSFFLLVIDDKNNIIGLVTSEDLLGEKPIQTMQTNRLRRDQITTKMLMTPIHNVLAFHYQDIESSRVGNVLATLQDRKSGYSLVIKKEANKEIISGIFIASLIKKKMNLSR